MAQSYQSLPENPTGTMRMILNGNFSDAILPNRVGNASAMHQASGAIMATQPPMNFCELGPARELQSRPYMPGAFSHGESATEFSLLVCVSGKRVSRQALFAALFCKFLFREERPMTRHLPYTSANPFVMWNTLAMKTWEMMFASAQVIGHRTGRMALAGPVPSARDQREFHLMGQEKVEATAESLQAIALRMFSLNQQIGLIAFQQWVATWRSLISLIGSRTVPQTLKVQTDMLHNTMSHATSAMNHLGESVAKTMHKGLTPIHSRATANARRLGRTKLLK